MFWLFKFLRFLAYYLCFSFLLTLYLYFFGESTDRINVHPEHEMLTPVLYKMYHPTHGFVGHILGSIHYNLDEKACDTYRHRMKKIVANTDHIISELPLNTNTFVLKKNGTEGIVKSLYLEQNRLITCSGLETALFQISLLSNNLRIGSRDVIIPWGYRVTRDYPFVVAVMNVVYSVAVNIFNKTILKRAFEKRFKQDKIDGVAFFQRLNEVYIDGNIMKLNGYSNGWLKINERNYDMVLKLNTLIGETPHNVLIVVGAFHLPGDHGLLSHLQQLGFELKPVQV